MNIKVNLADGTPAQFKTEIIDGNLVVTVAEEEQEVNLFPKWEELGEIEGHFVNMNSLVKYGYGILTESKNEFVFTTSELAKASLATARVSQTYRRYRELVGEVDNLTIVRYYGLSSLAFRDESDWDKFYTANKEDLNLINYVEDTVQL